MSLRKSRPSRFAWLLVLLLLAVQPLAAQERQPRQLTVASALARFDGTPFTTDDWIVEIIEINTDTRDYQRALAFWGPDAPAFPLQIHGLRWSFRGNLLAMTFLERNGDEHIAVYDPAGQSLELVLPPDANLLDISPIDWSQRDDWLVFSAREAGSGAQVMRLDLQDGELSVLAEGRLPSLGPDDETVAFLDTEDVITILSLADDSQRSLPGMYPGTSSLIWSGDGARLALTSEAFVSTIDIQSGRVRRVFDASVYLDVPAEGLSATTRSVAWSPDNRTLAFVLTVTDHAALGSISQVLGVDAQDGTPELYAERRFADDSPDDPRIFLEVTYQSRGAFLPPRDSGSDL